MYARPNKEIVYSLENVVMEFKKLFKNFMIAIQNIKFSCL